MQTKKWKRHRTNFKPINDLLKISESETVSGTCFLFFNIHQTELPTSDASSDIESKGNKEGKEAAFICDEGVLAQMIGVGILELGLILHRCGKFI